MKKIISKTAHLLCLIGFVSCASLPSYAGVINLNVSIKGYPPYTLLEEEGEASGIIVDLLKTIAQKHGHSLAYHQIPRKRVDHMILSGELDATPRAIEWTPKPEDYIFTDSIIAMRDVLFFPHTKPLQFERIEDLLGKRLRTHIGYSYSSLDKYFESGKIYRHDDQFEEQMLQNVLMSKGRFDAAIVDEMVGLWIIKNNNWEGKLIPSKNDVAAVEYRLMFNKRFAAFVEQFNAELEMMKRDGSLKQIIERYTQRIKQD